MLRLVQLDSNETCMDFLNSVTVQADLQNGQFNMARPWFNKAKLLRDEFATTKQDHDNNYRSYLMLIRKRRVCFNLLKRTVRDFDISLTNRIQRLQQDGSISSLYNASSKGERASARTINGWQVIAGERINGDLLAVEAGIEAMANPSAAELQVCLDELVAVQGQAEQIDRDFQQTQRRMGELRAETVNVWRIIYYSIRALTPELEDSAQRRLLRSFGFRYRFVKDPEKPDSSSSTNENENTGEENNENNEGNENNEQPNNQENANGNAPGEQNLADANQKEVNQENK